MTEFFSSPGFDQAIERAAQAVFDSEVVGPLDSLVDGEPVTQIVRAALLAALQPEPCRADGCVGGAIKVGPEDINGIRLEEVCRGCGGSAVSPPALWLALSEQVTDAKGRYILPRRGATYRYVPLSTTTNEASTT